MQVAVPGVRPDADAAKLPAPPLQYVTPNPASRVGTPLTEATALVLVPAQPDDAA